MDGDKNISISGTGEALDTDSDSSPGGSFVFGAKESYALYRLFADSDQNRVVNVFEFPGFRQTLLIPILYFDCTFGK